MKNLFLVFVFSISTFGLVHGQHGAPSDPSYVTINLVTIEPFQPNPLITPVILKGSPYIADEYKTGTAIIHGKTDFSAPMRYNSAKGVIEFLGDDRVKKEMLRRPYIKASFGGKLYEILEYSQKGKTKLGYFNVLSFGKTKLLFKPMKKILAGHNGTKNSRGEIEAHYKDVSGYYLKKEGQPARKIKLNKKSVLNSFDVKIRKLLEFAGKNQDLNLTKEKDVIRLLEYYDIIKQNSAEAKEMQS